MTLIKRELELPPKVAREFVADMDRFFAESNRISNLVLMMRDER
jgi:hypothetical protein